MHCAVRVELCMFLGIELNCSAQQGASDAPQGRLARGASGALAKKEMRASRWNDGSCARGTHDFIDHWPDLGALLEAPGREASSRARSTGRRALRAHLVTEQDVVAHAGPTLMRKLMRTSMRKLCTSLCWVPRIALAPCGGAGPNRGQVLNSGGRLGAANPMELNASDVCGGPQWRQPSGKLGHLNVCGGA